MINIKIGNCLDVLKELPKHHFHTVVTSPPYYGLRDYNTGTWIGGDPNCPHKRLTKISKDTATGHANMYEHGDVVGDAIYRQECPICGAKRQDDQIGLELTPQDYVSRLVEVFRGVRDTLRDDGTVWLNLGDSYHNYRADGGSNVKQSVHSTKHDQPESSPHRANKIHGLKQKDLMGIPWRVAFALQEDGWYLRQDIIWHKPNPMPESVKDRCTKAHEYLFLLSKNSHYYFDHEAIQEEATDWGTRDRSNGKYHNEGTGLSPHTGLEKSYETKNKRSVWTVNTKPYKEAHFAVFPTDLIEPCIKAGSPKDGHVLDPFGGSGTTGLVADRLNRNATVIELNKDYVDIAEKRIMGETPMFTKVSIE